MKLYAPHGHVAAELASGAIVAPGSFVELDDEAAGDPHNKQLVTEGRLLKAPAKESPPRPRGQSEKEGDA